MTAPELADRLEVSRRTINRDIDELCKAGVPIITHRGTGGGIQISNGYTIDRTMLTSRDLEYINIGVKALDSVSENPPSVGILDKLGYGSKNSLLVNDYVGIDLASYYKESLSVNIKVIKKAISERKKLSFEYNSKSGSNWVVIEPYFLLFKWSSWYLYGYNIAKDAYRLYKLNRILVLSMTDEDYIPRDILLEQLDVDSFFEDKILLKAVFDAKVKYRIIDEYGQDSFRPDEKGNLYFERFFTDWDYLFQWVLSFGNSIQVYEPREMISEIIRHAEDVIKIYKLT